MAKEKKIRLTVDLSEDDFLRFKVACALTGKSLSEVARTGIAREVRSLEKRASNKANSMNPAIQVQP